MKVLVVPHRGADSRSNVKRPRRLRLDRMKRMVDAFEDWAPGEYAQAMAAAL